MKKAVALYFLIIVSPLIGLSQKCEFDCYKITQLDNTRAKTCYFFDLDSSADLMIYKTTYTINNSLKAKAPLWIITFNLFKDKDSISVSFLNKETDMNGNMNFKYNRDYFPVIFNNRDKDNEPANCYDLTVTDDFNYKILFSIYNPDRPFIILNKFQPPGNNFVTYELSTLKEMRDSLDKNILPRHINKSIRYWLDKEEKKDRTTNEESYYINLAKALNFINKGDSTQARIMLNNALTFKPGDKFASTQIERVNRLSQEKTIAVNPEITSPVIPTDPPGVEDKYESIINIGVGLLIAGDSLMGMKSYQAAIASYEAALKTYTEASVLKPLEQLPKSQTRYIKQEIKGAKLELEEKRLQDSVDTQNKLIRNYIKIIEKADSAKSEKRYEDAINAYNEALKILQDSILIRAGYRLGERAGILLNINICENQLNRLKNGSGYLLPGRKKEQFHLAMLNINKISSMCGN